MTTDDAEVEIANQTLTDVQLLTWGLRHLKGLSIGAIADQRGVTKATVRECLATSERRIREAQEVE